MSLKDTTGEKEAVPAKEKPARPKKQRRKPAAAKASGTSARAPKAEAAPAAEKPAAGKPDANTREYVMPDLGRLAINLMHAANLGQKAARQLMRTDDSSSDASHALHDLQRVGRTLMDIAASYMRNPAKIVEAQTALWEGYVGLASNLTRRLLGEDVPPVAAPSRSDKRFRDPDWHENLIFDLMKQSYLLTSKWMTDRVKLAEGVDQHTREKADFYVRQMANAFSPSNFLFTNPEILRTTLATNGENLVSGMEHLLEDIERGHGHIQIQQTDMSAFRLGENIATTPGKVVYQNEEFNLLQAALGIEDDIENLRYNKVVLATDADVDGMHIRLLALTFFLQFFPDLIREGHLYILETPLFRVRNKQETRYCYTEEERLQALEEVKNPEITRFKGLGEISPDEFKFFISENIRLSPVEIPPKPKAIQDLLTFYMGKNTPQRQEFIIRNLKVETDLIEEEDHEAA